MNLSLNVVQDLPRVSLRLKPGQQHASKRADTLSLHTSAKRDLDDASEKQKHKKQKVEHNNTIRADLHDFKMRMMKNQAERREKPRNKYHNGALRLTRTPGRHNTANTVSLEDLIDRHFLCSAMVYAFFIENPYVFDFFPFQKRPNPRPHIQIYVGRDLSMDADGRKFSGCKKKFPKGDEFNRVVKCAQDGYRDTYGSNFNAFYPPEMKSGCAHSKLMVLVYPDFLRVVITSANLMQTDVVLGDNTWYIQDFPRLAEGIKYEETSFEQDLRIHVEELGCPNNFVDTYMKPGRFDFSAAKVHLVTSRPGSFSGEEANWYGQLRLRDVVRREILASYSKDNSPPKMAFEVCVDSVGHLEKEGVIKQLLKSCAGALQKSIEGKPALKMIFPTSSQVTLDMDGSCNISSHINWSSLKDGHYLKGLFHHYYSKDPGCLFHLKTILALRADNPKATPIYMYTGSANFSKGAWGAVMPEKREAVIARTLATERVEKIANYECGVVIRGEDIAGMLETGKWEDVVPYERPSEANHYRKGERPWTVPKSAFQPPMDGHGDSDEDDEDEDGMEDEEESEMKRLAGHPLGINLVRLLSGAKVHLTGNAR
ncbi:Phospholipase D/nuclease [Mycena sanguinolenta]|uniref:Phospholipase D/nuclease n=1 Tax=Mycena sanguinolenta TaxID=230812 RepID=A0A8H6YY81_9AGAR|nr:Phospholipase D/nuclease [Mycena sanguinolenta]